MVPLFDFFEPDLHITRFDTLNGESNPLVFRQIDFLQRLEYAVLVKCVNLSHDGFTSFRILRAWPIRVKLRTFILRLDGRGISPLLSVLVIVSTILYDEKTR